MNQKLSKYAPGPRSLFAALAITALAAIGSPGTASASTTAKAKIVNVATVDYWDQSGTTKWKANAASTITVNLVRAQLNFTGPPTSSGGQPSLICQTGGSFASGSTISALYALTATANGSDSYNLSMPSKSGSDASIVSIEYSNVDKAGNLITSNPSSITNWGSAIPVGVKPLANDTLLFPGGALEGFAVNDIVIVTQGANKVAYLVKAVDAKTAPVHSNADGSPHTTEGSFTTAEVKGELQLGAFATQNLTWNGSAISFGGSASDPDFIASPVAIGTTVSELQLIRVDVKATSTSISTDGTVSYKLSTTDGAPTAGSLSENTCGSTGNYIHTQLRIQKEVTSTPGSNYASSATATTTNAILEYRLTIDNPGGTASKVKVTDAVPAYTTLVAGSAYGVYGAGDPTDIFAKADVNGETAINITVQSTDIENNSVTSGDAAGIIATKALTFYVGAGNDNANGGSVDKTSIFHIYYRVKVD